ncbi:MAG: 4-alpha-glucanotransferase [Rhodobacteraceae bacterium]|nr:4-alpha-glucanotransferase [Paracoccaceae bacterium]
MTDPVAELAAASGILPRYTDTTKTVRETSRETEVAILAAMGIRAGTEAEARESLADLQTGRGSLPDWAVVETGARPMLAIDADQEWRLHFEGGECHEGRGPDSLPVLPLGRHRLELGDQITWILAAPTSLAPPGRGWGLTVPLAGLRGPKNGGFGDFNDLREAGLAAARAGAGFIGINPVHAGFPTDATAFSPYSPSHRRRLNTLHVALGDAPPEEGPLIDYHAAIPAKRIALRRAFDAFEAAGSSPEFEAFLAAEGEPLRRFALHQALSDRHGPYWTDWPAEFQDPASPAVAEAARDEAQAIRFHAWAQWMAATQLGSVSRDLQDAGMAHGLYLDLAVGTHPAGAETWMERDQFAQGASLGAPPDAFAPDGQTWGVAPLNPTALIADGFRTLAETLRAQLRHARLLRIDHILGFDRAFWVPEGAPGAYVKMPLQAMLAVARIEAARAGATIVGEDLGNIPDGLQDALAASGILGCRLIQFEQKDGAFKGAESYDSQALASFGTHDLATWAGWGKGADIAARVELGHIDPERGKVAFQTRQAEAEALQAAIGGDGSAEAMHRFLGRTAARLVTVQVEDVLDIKDQPNLPGTIDDYPNWRQRLHIGAGEFALDPRLGRVGEIMKATGR